jgi:hypothetical protein
MKGDKGRGVRTYWAEDVFGVGIAETAFEGAGYGTADGGEDYDVVGGFLGDSRSCGAY